MEGEITVGGLIRRVKEILPSPDKWTQKAMARDTDGSACPVWSERAVSFCISGAAQRAFLHKNDMSSYFYLMSHIKSKVGTLAGLWNDCSDRTFEQVIELLDSLALEFPE